MEQIVQMWLACQNAGEPLRAWSLFSDGYLFRLLSRQGGLSGEAYRVLATPAPVAAEAAVVLAIEGERLLPDGRYGATVTVSYPSVPMPKRFFFFFTQDRRPPADRRHPRRDLVLRAVTVGRVQGGGWG